MNFVVLNRKPMRLCLGLFEKTDALCHDIPPYMIARNALRRMRSKIHATAALSLNR